MPPKRMTANPVRPARYRPGKPTAPEQPSDSSDSDSGSESESDAAPPPPPPPKPVYSKKKKLAPAPALKDVDLAARFDEGKKAEEARLADEAADVDDEYTTEESEGSEEDESEEEEEEEEVGADYEAAGEVGAKKKVLLRPTFLPKSKRAAVGAAAAATDAPDDAQKRAAEEERQRQDATELLELRLKRDAEARAAGRRGWDDDEDTGEGIDDTDGVDPAAERATWKLRELKRIKRERESLAAIEAERSEIERRREMDPSLREKEDLEFVREQRKEKMDARGKMGFMQKFYHKGAFYQEEDILKKRDYATAEVEDSAKNREVLPKYMQVRGDEVGKRGRTRWTHLSAEDTSLQAGGSPWSEKKGSNRFPVGGGGGGAGGDERFMPDRPVGRESGFGRDDVHRERGGYGGRDGGGEGGREVDSDRVDSGRGGRERGGGGGRWDERESSKPRDYSERRPRDDSRQQIRRDDGGGGGRRPFDGPRRDHERSGRDDDRERKRPHSPRLREQEGEKRRRREASSPPSRGA